MQLCKLPKNDQPVTSTQEIKGKTMPRMYICVKQYVHVFLCVFQHISRFLPMMIRILKEEAMKVCLSVAGIVQKSQRMKLTMHNALIIGFPMGWPPGHPQEHVGNGTFLTIFWARGVGTFLGFGNKRFTPQGCTHGIWSPLVSGTWFSKSRMNSLPPFVFHFLNLLHVCSSLCRCTKPGMFYEEKESLLLPTVSMNSLWKVSKIPFRQISSFQIIHF